MANLLNWSGISLQKKKDDDTYTPLITTLNTLQVPKVTTANTTQTTSTPPLQTRNVSTSTKSAITTLTEPLQNLVAKKQANTTQNTLVQDRLNAVQKNRQSAEDLQNQQEARRREQEQQWARYQQQTQRSLRSTPKLNGGNNDFVTIRTNMLKNAQNRLANTETNENIKASNAAAETLRKATWGKYYDDEFKKASQHLYSNSPSAWDQWATFVTRSLDGGATSRLAEQNARTKYASALFKEAYDEDGNVKSQAAVDLLDQMNAENEQVGQRYWNAERAKSRYLGASYDSDTYSADNSDFWKRVQNTFNIIRSADVGSAVLGPDDIYKTDASDVGRFLVNLIPQAVPYVNVAYGALRGAPTLVEGAVGTGKDKETGLYKQLDATERAGRIVSGGIDAVAPFWGGSGDLLKAASSALFKKGASAAVKEAAKQTTTSVIKQIAKSMLEEGTEEYVQQIADFFGDGGKIITSDGQFDKAAFDEMMTEAAQAGALGAVGGGLMSGANVAISKANAGIKSLRNKTNANTDTNTSVSTNTNTNVNENTDINGNVAENADVKPSRVQTEQDGSMVKTNTDGTTTRLTDGELTNIIANDTAPRSIAVNAMESVPQSVPVNTANTASNIINPVQSNQVSVRSGSEDINTLAKQAEQGSTYAQKRLAGLTEQNQNENTDWRGKSVDEVINPEDTLNQRASDAESEEIANELTKLYGELQDAAVAEPKYNEENSMQRIMDVQEGRVPLSDYLNEQRELMWQSFKDSNRGTETLYTRDNENGQINGRRTVSENGTLYRMLYAEYGGKPTKAEFNAAVDDVLQNGANSKYYAGFRELDPVGDTAVFGFNQGNEGIDMILALQEDMKNSVNDVAPSVEATEQSYAPTEEDIRKIQENFSRQSQQDNIEVATGTEPIGVAEDGTPEFVKRYTNQTTIEGVDNSRRARQSRLKQVIDSFKESDNPIVKKFYELLHGDRTKSVVANLTEAEARRYAAEGGVPIANDAKFVMTDNFARHEDNDGHLTGIWRRPEPTTGIEVDANPLTATDIGMLDALVKNPDSIMSFGKVRDGQRLKIEKQIDNNYRIIADVVSDGKELNLVSYYKQNKNPLVGVLADLQGNPVSNAGVQVKPSDTRIGTADQHLNNSISDNTNNVNQSPRNYAAESEALPADFDVKHYISDQVEAQRKRSKLPLRERIADATAELKHYLVDDAVAYERYIKDKNERLNIREGVDRVRSSNMQACQWMLDHGLQEIGKMSDANLNEFQQYLIAKRAEEVAEQGKTTGRSRAADQALIKYIGDKYAKEEAIVRQYTHDMLEYSAKNGLISKKLKDDLIKNNPNYVPLNRVFDNMEEKTGFRSKQLGNLSKQSVVQRLKGSERVIDNPIESLMNNTMRMINEVERNNTAKMIAQSEAFHEKVLAEGEKPRAGYDKLTYLVDGKQVSYEVPELVAKEMKNLNSVLPDAVEQILKIIGAPTRWLRSGATQNNPLFALSNLARDQGQTLITGSLKSSIKGTPKAIAATFGFGENANALRAELNRAGIIGSEYRQTYGYKPNDLVKQLQADSKLSKSAINKLKHPIDAIGDLIGKTEYFTRAQQYFGTDGDAATKAQAARNNTLNFSRAGAATRIMNRVIPFLNAGVQGGRATVNAFAKRPVHTVLAYSTIMGVAALARGAAEAQNKELWDRLDDSDKEQNIIIFTPDAHYDGDSNRVEGIVKIPVAQMTYPAMDFVNNRKGDASDVIQLGTDILTAVTGLEMPNEENGILPVLNQLTPTAVKPFLEAGINKSTYTGNDIVSEYDSNKNPEDKGVKYTTGLARSIASVTGIDAPIVDNFIQNWGGGLAKDLSKTLTDNPDNSKDGGGIGAMFESGFNRRFLSGTVTSQYEIAEGLATNYKNKVKSTDEYKDLSSADQQEVLNAIDTDMNSIASIATKVEQGREGEINSNLTKRQTEIANNGFDAKKYIASVVDKNTSYAATSSDGSDINTLSGNVSDYGNTSTRNNAIKISDSLTGASRSVLEFYNSMSSDDWNSYLYGNNAESAAAEYNLALAKYENDLANGDLSEVQKITRQKELAKLEVSQRWTKDYRDAYSLASNKADMQTYLNGLDDDRRASAVAILNGLNNAMYNAGIITASTYKTRYNAINNASSISTSSSTSSGTSKYGGITSAEVSAMSSLAKTLSKNNTSNSNTKTKSAPTTKRKFGGTSSSSGKTGLSKYSSGLAKNVTVSKGSKQNIA